MDDDMVKHGLNGDDEPLPTVSNGARNRDGTFGKGNRYGHGNPCHARMHELRKSLLDSDLATPATVRAVFSRLLRKALGDPDDKTGASADLDACRLYLSYVLGRPTLAVELSGPEGSPVPLAVAAADPAVLERAREGLDAWRSEMMERFKAERERIARMREDGVLPPGDASWG
jgi:hypothetical protein